MKLADNISALNILLVDYDPLHIDIISKKLNKIGIYNIVCVTSFTETTEYLSGHTPDLILLDYYLDGKNTAKNLVKESLNRTNIPFIIISSFYGEEIINDVMELGPHDFLPKNVSEFDLAKSISLSVQKYKYDSATTLIKSFIFVRTGKEIKRINVHDICFVTVDGKYLELHTTDKRFLVRSTLIDFEKRLPEFFIKIHKAYIINLYHMDSLNMEEGVLMQNGKVLPLSRNFRKDLLSQYLLV